MLGIGLFFELCKNFAQKMLAPTMASPNFHLVDEVMFVGSKSRNVEIIGNSEQ
jgi:hypothetical protein